MELYSNIYMEINERSDSVGLLGAGTYRPTKNGQHLEKENNNESEKNFYDVHIVYGVY